MDARKFAAEIATVVVRHGIDLAGLQDAIAAQAVEIRILIKQRQQHKAHKQGVPARNLEIFRLWLDGKGRKHICATFGLGYETVSIICATLQREIVKKAYDSRQPFEQIADDYNMSANEVQDVVMRQLAYTRSGIVRDTHESRYDEYHQASQVNEVRRITAFLGDADYVNFVIRDFDDAFAPNDSDRLILWTTEPVIVHKSNGEVFAIRPEQAEEIMRSVGVLQDIAVYNGEGIKRMERPSGQRIWP